MSILVSVREESIYWGAVDGKEVWLFCLRNARGTKLFVSNYGATAQALCLRTTNGLYEDVLLGYDTLEGYEQDEFYIGSVIGRYANRIGKGQFEVNGQRHQLHVRNGGYHLHGGEQGFGKKVFDFKQQSFSQPSTIVFSYTSPDGEEGFPGRLKLEVSYTLTEDDSWEIEYRATTDKATIVNFTQHAYFNLSGMEQDSVGKHELKIYSQRYLPVNGYQLPTGQLNPVRDTPFNFSHFKKMEAQWDEAKEQLRISGGYDHSFVLEEQKSARLKKAATVRLLSHNRQMEVWTTEPAVHFYSGNFLNVPSGKNGKQYGPRAGFCLETGHFPDAPNHAHFPSTVLQAGERFYSKTLFKFSWLSAGY